MTQRSISFDRNEFKQRTGIQITNHLPLSINNHWSINVIYHDEKIIRQLQSLPLIKEGAQCYSNSIGQQKEHQTLNNQTSDVHFNRTKTIKIEKKTERNNIILLMTSYYHQETGSNSKKMIDRQFQTTIIPFKIFMLKINGGYSKFHNYER